MEAVLMSSLGRAILRNSIVTIGRAPDNELVIHDPKVSAHHAHIRPYQQSYGIVDLGSTNGTFVNEVRLTKAVPYLLHSGDICRLGDFTFTYEEYPSTWRDNTDTASPLPPSDPDFDPPSPNTRSEPTGSLGGVSYSQDLPDIGAPANTGDLLPSAPPAQEYLQFTAFHPRIIPVETWSVLLVYAYIESALEAVRSDAYKFREQLGSESFKVDAWASHPLIRGDRITIVPTVEGVAFSPDRIAFEWDKDWHRAFFNFSTDRRSAGSVKSGEIIVFNGPLIIASLKISLRFGEQSLHPNSNQEEVSAYQYRKIFASYSHNDTPIVLAIRKACETIGDDSFLDIEKLRSGQSWNHALLRMIDNADIFQLFWSERSAQSAYVSQEWQYALQHYKYEGFIRPVFWEKPMTHPPAELSHLHFAYYELPQPVETSKKHSLFSRLSSIFMRE